MSEDARPKTVQELVRHLADTLVENEVMNPMDQISWGHGTPPPPKAADNPPVSGGAPPAVAPPPTPNTVETTSTPGQQAPVAAPAKTDAPLDLVATLESLRDPVTGLIMGKYKDVPAALQGAGHLASMAKQSFVERDAAVRETARLNVEIEKLHQTPPAVSPAAVPTLPAVGAQSRDALKQAQESYELVLRNIAEEGGLLDEDATKKLSAAQRELARAEAKAAVEETLLQRDGAVSAEQAKWDAVNEYMERTHPDSKQFADEIGLYVQSQPLVQEAVAALVAQGKEQKAAELAWVEFDSARTNGTLAATLTAAANKQIQLEAGDQVRREAIDAARKDAGIPGTSAGGVHERTDTAPSRDEIAAAAAAMRAYGSQPGNPAAARWRELTIGRMLPPEIFGS